MSVDSVDRDSLYKDDQLRLLTFTLWNNSNVSKESLALAGFYFIGGMRQETSDVVRCAWCGGELNNWLPGDCPLREHLSHFPHCGYAKKMASRYNIIQSQSSNDDLLLQNMSELGIMTHRPPSQQNYVTYKSRLNSYRDWPEYHTQKPEILALAGFYYTGSNDLVRCFHCDVGLCLWEPTDNPYIEHAKYQPDCNYLNIIKGKDFINKYKRNLNSYNSSCNENDDFTQLSPISQPFTESDVENCMESSSVNIALQCGIQPERIRMAIRKRLQQTGTSFKSPTQLIDAALNEQINELPFNIPDNQLSLNTPSSSSVQYPVDEAEVDEITRSIINVALIGANENIQNSTLESVEVVEGVEEQNLEETITENNLYEIENEIEVGIEPFPYEPHISEMKSLQNNDEVKSHFTIQNISLEEENKMLRDARTCKICMDDEVNVVFLPCGHLVSCVVCATGLAQCPICRANVKGVVRTYLS